MQKLEGTTGFVPECYALTYKVQRLDPRESLNEYGVEDKDILKVYEVQVGGKPIIYLFFNQALDVSFSLHLIPQWSFSAIYPVISIEEHKNRAQDIV
jgi:hypothetical protein